MADPDRHWVALWNPPVNKGTVARVFHDEEKAWSFVRERLEPTGWPMNVRVIVSDERHWQDEAGQGERQYPETD